MDVNRAGLWASSLSQDGFHPSRPCQLPRMRDQGAGSQASRPDIRWSGDFFRRSICKANPVFARRRQPAIERLENEHDNDHNDNEKGSGSPSGWFLIHSEPPSRWREAPCSRQSRTSLRWPLKKRPSLTAAARDALLCAATVAPSGLERKHVAPPGGKNKNHNENKRRLLKVLDFGPPI
jgi:hypothetical protein